MHGCCWGNPCRSGSSNHNKGKGSTQPARVFLGLGRPPSAVWVLTNKGATRTNRVLPLRELASKGKEANGKQACGLDCLSTKIAMPYSVGAGNWKNY